MRSSRLALVFSWGLALSGVSLPAADVFVQVQNFSFTPKDLTIAPGDRVVWEFIDGGHTTTSAVSSAEKWDSGFMPAGSSFSRIFSNEETFPYVCTPHASFMSGSVTVIAAAAPTITSFLPSSGEPGTGVLIGGTNFTGATQVAFNGVAAGFVVNSSTQLAASVPEGATTGRITVTTPGGTATSATDFVVVLQPPIVAGLDPASGPTSGGTAVLVTGSRFRAGATVMFGSAAAALVTFIDGSRLTAVTPSHAEGKVVVSVRNPDGLTATFDGFTFTPAASTLTFRPLRGARRTQVVIEGAGAASPTAVHFNGLPAIFRLRSDGRIAALVPDGATTGAISVTTTAGIVTSGAAFEVTPDGRRKRPAGGR